MNPALPLAGVVVVDLTRMLPGAVAARALLDLGARVIKVEDPRGGDPLRSAPPVVDGVGAGFRAFYRGAEFLALDLRTPEGARNMRRLAKQADVVVESFRPGTLGHWGLDPERLRQMNASLITVSLSAFGAHDDRVAHDLNLVAASGLLDALSPSVDGALPKVQLADVTTGLLAVISITTALLQRQFTHRGMHLDQPLVTGPLPFLAWPTADLAAGSAGLPQTVLAGEAPGYARYVCGDGLELAVGAIEPKFWRTFAQALDLPEWAEAGLAVGPEGQHVKAAIARRLAKCPRAEWLMRLAPLNLPVSPVHALADAGADPDFSAPPGHRALTSWFPSWGTASAPREVPAWGADQSRLLQYFCLESS